jgi:hypothetical protein
VGSLIIFFIGERSLESPHVQLHFEGPCDPLAIVAMIALSTVGKSV